MPNKLQELQTLVDNNQAIQIIGSHIEEFKKYLDRSSNYLETLSLPEDFKSSLVQNGELIANFLAIYERYNGLQKVDVEAVDEATIDEIKGFFKQNKESLDELALLISKIKLCECLQQKENDGKEEKTAWQIFQEFKNTMEHSDKDFIQLYFESEQNYQIIKRYISIISKGVPDLRILKKELNYFITIPPTNSTATQSNNLSLIIGKLLKLKKEIADKLLELSETQKMRSELKELLKENSKIAKTIPALSLDVMKQIEIARIAEAEEVGDRPAPRKTPTPQEALDKIAKEKEYYTEALDKATKDSEYLKQLVADAPQKAAKLDEAYSLYAKSKQDLQATFILIKQMSLDEISSFVKVDETISENDRPSFIEKIKFLLSLEDNGRHPISQEIESARIILKNESFLALLSQLSGSKKCLEKNKKLFQKLLSDVRQIFLEKISRGFAEDGYGYGVIFSFIGMQPEEKQHLEEFLQKVNYNQVTILDIKMAEQANTMLEKILEHLEKSLQINEQQEKCLETLAEINRLLKGIKTGLLRYASIEEEQMFKEIETNKNVKCIGLDTTWLNEKRDKLISSKEDICKREKERNEQIKIEQELLLKAISKLAKEINERIIEQIIILEQKHENSSSSSSEKTTKTKASRASMTDSKSEKNAQAQKTKISSTDPKINELQNYKERVERITKELAELDLPGLRSCEISINAIGSSVLNTIEEIRLKARMQGLTKGYKERLNKLSKVIPPLLEKNLEEQISELRKKESNPISLSVEELKKEVVRLESDIKILDTLSGDKAFQQYLQLQKDKMSSPKKKDNISSLNELKLLIDKYNEMNSLIEEGVQLLKELEAYYKDFVAKRKKDYEFFEQMKKDGQSGNLLLEDDISKLKDRIGKLNKHFKPLLLRSELKKQKVENDALVLQIQTIAPEYRCRECNQNIKDFFKKNMSVGLELLESWQEEVEQENATLKCELTRIKLLTFIKDSLDNEIIQKWIQKPIQDNIGLSVIEPKISSVQLAKYKQILELLLPELQELMIKENTIIKSLSGYDLFLMSEGFVPKPWQMGVCIENGKLRYKVISPKGEFIEDTIEGDMVGQELLKIFINANKDSLIEDLTHHLGEILKITSKKGHTRPSEQIIEAMKAIETSIAKLDNEQLKKDIQFFKLAIEKQKLINENRAVLEEIRKIGQNIFEQFSQFNSYLYSLNNAEQTISEVERDVDNLKLCKQNLTGELASLLAKANIESLPQPTKSEPKKETCGKSRIFIFWRYLREKLVKPNVSRVNQKQLAHELQPEPEKGTRGKDDIFAFCRNLKVKLVEQEKLVEQGKLVKPSLKEDEQERLTYIYKNLASIANIKKILDEIYTYFGCDISRFDISKYANIICSIIIKKQGVTNIQEDLKFVEDTLTLYVKIIKEKHAKFDPIIRHINRQDCNDKEILLQHKQILELIDKCTESGTKTAKLLIWLNEAGFITSSKIETFLGAPDWNTENGAELLPQLQTYKENLDLLHDYLDTTSSLIKRGAFDKRDLYLISVAEETDLPDLSHRAIDKLPVLVKKGSNIYIYGRKAKDNLEYTQLAEHKFNAIKFPDIGHTEISISKELVGKAIYDEITLKEGHILAYYDDLLIKKDAAVQKDDILEEVFAPKGKISRIKEEVIVSLKRRKEALNDLVGKEKRAQERLDFIKLVGYCAAGTTAFIAALGLAVFSIIGLCVLCAFSVFLLGMGFAKTFKLKYDKAETLAELPPGSSDSTNTVADGSTAISAEKSPEVGLASSFDSQAISAPPTISPSESTIDSPAAASSAGASAGIDSSTSPSPQKTPPAPEEIRSGSRVPSTSPIGILSMPDGERTPSPVIQNPTPERNFLPSFMRRSISFFRPDPVKKTQGEGSGQLQMLPENVSAGLASPNGL